ncbi:hypothetical protein SAMN05216463_103178 [Xylanibacter ruminicola]|jgi:hypothetical protein|uniref:Uncharacterized protein n=1 Tax=Xylanibacter ruminicola TaxID=839 RepID=A0A1M6SH24_XYLRU|nr:hypothetical protein SAMN05216463_103178 [Xylanibacter ruminicola]
MVFRYFILFIIVLLLSTKPAFAGIDPGRVAAIELASDQAKKALKSQEKAQLLMTTGHAWIKEEVEATTDFQREFNDYLDKFHDVLSIAAEIYGIYYEVTQTSKNVKALGEVLSDSPSNALAVAFSTRRNVVYRNIVRTTLDVIMDIRKVCFEKSKMTEEEKNKVISSIRPKLRTINKQLRQLTLTLRYTSFLDVWNELMDRAYYLNPATKHDIITRCRRQWWNNAKSVR